MKKEDSSQILFLLGEYTKACTEAFTKRSEQVVYVVDKTIQFLSEDASRISKMSQETLDVLNETRSLISKDMQSVSENSFQGVITVLKRLSGNSNEIEALIMPIIQSLQFQDRMRQQMENSTKMLGIWLSERESFSGKKMSTEEQLAFAGKLMNVTTTDEERIAIRARFPNLPQQKKVSGDDFFL